MTDKPKHPKRPRDINQHAASTIAIVTGQIVVDTTKATPTPEPTPEDRHNAATILGSKGGRARSAKLTPEQRKEIAQKAAKARWHK